MKAVEKGKAGPNEEIRRVAFCPHCGNMSTQRFMFSQTTSERAWDIEDEEETEIDVANYVALCETCNMVLVYQIYDTILYDKDFIHAKLVYPDSGKLHQSVPSNVADIYNEAFRIKRLAPNAFAVQIRRALEALCEDRGAKAGTLQTRLKELADNGEIPAKLAEMSNVLRLLGNIGAHAAVESVKSRQVEAIDGFFRAVVEYVYVAPSKLAEFRASLEKFDKRSPKPDAIAG